jgi:hypothetical protein
MPMVGFISKNKQQMTSLKVSIKSKESLSMHEEQIRIKGVWLS